MKLITLKCPDCGATFDIKEDRKICFCSYCGGKMILDNEEQKLSISKNINITNHNINDADIIKAKNDEKENKRGWIALIFCAIIAFGIPFGMLAKFEIQERIAHKEGKVSVGYYRDLKGKDYQTVVAHFEAAGFNNIQVIDLNDYGILTWQDGKVIEVSVAGNNSFEDTDYFSVDSKVVISHH